MSRIYSEAYLVLAVQSATDCQDGFLEVQNEAVENAKHFTAIDLDGAVQRKTVQRKIMGFHDDPNYLLSGTALSRRAWTLQEIFFARRILHFTDKEMIWECPERIKCRCGRDSVVAHSTALKLTSSDYSRDEWRKLVESYSNRSLTRPEDKLPAMAAITAHLSQEWHQSPTNFLAGIWRQDLICGLLWYPANIGPHYRASAYVAPSWSWASIIGGVEYPSLLHMNQWKFFTTMKVLEAETTPVLDPFGQITKGHIKAHGLLTQVELRLCRGKFESSRGEYGVGQSFRPTRVHDDQTVIVRRHQAQSYEVLCDEILGVEHLCEEEEEACWLHGSCSHTRPSCICEPVPTSSSFYCFQIGALKQVPEQGYSDDAFPGSVDTQLWWLVLKQSSLDNDTFERIGIGCRNLLGLDGCDLFDSSQAATIRLV